MPLPSSNFSMSLSLAAALAAIFFFGQAASQTANETQEEETPNMPCPRYAERGGSSCCFAGSFSILRFG
jgi:hypothetical protein